MSNADAPVSKLGNGNEARQMEPVDFEEPPHLAFPVVGIGASAGGLEAVIEFVKALPGSPGMAFVVIQHLPPDRDSMVAEIVSRHTTLPVRQVEDGIEVKANHVYVIRPGNTLTIERGRLHLSEPLNTPARRHPVDDFFRSLAEEQRERAICVVMSGMGSNGSAGAQLVKAVGGVCIAQDPDTAKFPSMPRSLINTGLADFVLTPQEMPEVLLRCAAHPYMKGDDRANSLIERDRQAIKEVLAVLRSRSGQDFQGYRKPTVIRRIQRRMGLHQVEQMGEYARLLRQNPSEAGALADDLVIHVTGFFRDPEAWEALRVRVIEPMVAEREMESSIRVWVTACSSGEEAYTVAILLAEAMEKAGKSLDVKIFATDLADRMLAHARAGVYPKGIEGELTQERLERYFEQDDAHYRLRREVREMVVFAPQNILQDPPFSKIDLCTCRNLLIYLEPEVQRRVLALLHFGLKQGGALFMGTSETVNGQEELFEVVDKRWRIYRRVGASRPEIFSFPRSAGASRTGEEGSKTITRASLAHVTERTLLERYAPASVVVDRQQRVVYFYGDTSRYLSHPRGEPTRDVLEMAREGVRGALRIALHRAYAEGEPTATHEGTIDEGQGRARVAVTVASLESGSLPGFYLVSFTSMPTATGGAASETAAAENGAPEMTSMLQELQRTRDELQSAVEELQTSNEELKASNEEVTSVNEELQSTNEELETSKEELQSLNEELSTVNAQLQAKMEELESVASDLGSLLSSTEIAVVFLDAHFRIRRFTPRARDLFELIPGDTGRPLSDLAHKFDDPALLTDAKKVLERLIPMEKEIVGTDHKWYLRRILPYRTTDDRIIGVVLTFVDITRRLMAEREQRESEELYRLLIQGVKEYAIFITDPAGLVTTWNPGAQRVLGYTEREAIGQHVRFLFTPEDQDRGVPEKELEHAKSQGQAVDERWHMRKDGRRIWVVGAVTPLMTGGQLRGFAKIMRDSTDQKVVEERLESSRREAERANEAKDHFLATVSHELRTPLSSILMWSKMLVEGVLPADEMAAAASAIERGAEAQRRLIEDLLDSSRISSGKLRLNMRETDIAAVVVSGVETLRPAAEVKKLELSVKTSADAGTVWGDPDRLQQVVWNLLSNAIKFTPAGGKVSVELKREADEVRIIVSDTGRGIKPEFLPRVFQRFTQADGSHTRAVGGLGLGLAISRQLVELHGGTVEANSAGVDKGSTFTVVLPLPAIKRTAEQASVKPQRDEGLQGIRVLLVEDEDESRRALTRLLMVAGVEVTAVTSAAEGLNTFRSVKPDLIVSDIGLPDVDGYAFIRQVRSMESAGHVRPVPALALTAFARDEDKQAAIRSGFQHHLSKPVDPHELRSTLLALLAMASPGG